MSAHIEVFQPEPESLKAKVERLVQRRLAEIMARRDLSSLAPFFESKQFTDALRRLQTAQDWHKFSVYYEKWGCISCHGRQKPHHALGMCRTCQKRIFDRLETILERLNQKTKDAERFIDALIGHEKLARKALGKSLPGSVEMLPAKIGRPKMKPSILPGDSGERVRKLRELAGMSQADLAVAAGVDRKTIISFEKGDHRAIPPHCDAIRRVLVEALVRAFWP